MNEDKFDITLDGKKKYTRIFRNIAGYTATKSGFIPYIEITCTPHPEKDDWTCIIDMPDLDESILLDETQLLPLSDTLKEIKILIDEQRK